ncbi:MAG: exonuclease subunit SbcD, partial [Dehalococcoidia bacterium]|nr:exonuclease subunit SbcD [Dehalococcoidia bacterium]
MCSPSRACRGPRAPRRCAATARPIRSAASCHERAVKILHTSDWHVGKHLGRYDRAAEFREALDEVQGIAEEYAVDLVVVAGDLWDRAAPPTDALGDGVNALVRLADGGRRAVVVIAGNHDSPELFDVLAPLLAPLGVHLIGRIRRPEAGGLLLLDTPGGRAAIGCVPFLREGRVVDFMAESGQWYGQYQERLARLFAAYGEALEREAATAVTVLVAHAGVSGVTIRDRELGRGERELHIGEAYMVLPSALPAAPQY